MSGSSENRFEVVQNVASTLYAGNFAQHPSGLGTGAGDNATIHADSLQHTGSERTSDGRSDRRRR